MTLISMTGGNAHHSHGQETKQTSASNPTPFDRVYLHRTELEKILSVYSRMVAKGQWRDYGIHFGKEAASFAIHRRTSEMPLYRIIKEPSLAKKQGIWRIVGASGQVLRRGHDLPQLLRFFDRITLKPV